MGWPQACAPTTLARAESVRVRPAGRIRRRRSARQRESSKAVVPAQQATALVRTKSPRRPLDDRPTALPHQVDLLPLDHGRQASQVRRSTHRPGCPRGRAATPAPIFGGGVRALGSDKIRIVLSVLSGEMTIAEAARQNKVFEQSVSRWKAQFLEGGRAGVAAGGSRGPRAVRSSCRRRSMS